MNIDDKEKSMPSAFMQPHSDEHIQRESSRQLGRPIDVRRAHVSQIRPEDTVFHEGRVRTVGHKDIRRDDFMGHTLFGDSYILGRRPVHRLVMGRTLEQMSAPA